MKKPRRKAGAANMSAVSMRVRVRSGRCILTALRLGSQTMLIFPRVAANLRVIAAMGCSPVVPWDTPEPSDAEAGTRNHVREKRAGASPGRKMPIVDPIASIGLSRRLRLPASVPLPARRSSRNRPARPDCRGSEHAAGVFHRARGFAHNVPSPA
jgi:hypothetical protein